eukprot:TRINITY_DN5607_c0_g1_i1.p1 TRINITY_DN5607_c0_g1~~TRINITY_DN5607_c0_g1_i1.p1  ORF type:complete len:109 (+),score=35.31 TRINITY_DN5607_c0_g1_i1:356-682(+)
MDVEVGRGVLIKQNNRMKRSKNQKSSKLFVSNFDILNKYTHKNLTKLLLQFGDLERDIVIGRDRKNNPFANVEFRDIQDAVCCVQSRLFSRLLSKIGRSSETAKAHRG